MQVSRYGFFILVFVLIGCNGAGGLNGLKNLKSELNAAGFDLVYPLTTGYEVGLLFEIRETAEGTRFRKTLCSATYDNASAHSERIILGTYESNDTTNFDVVAGLAESLLKDKAKASASLKANSVTKVSLTLDNAVAESLPPKLRPDGTRRSLNPACSINIKTAIDEAGRFKRPTILVVGRATTDRLTYTFEAEENTEASLSLLIKALFNVEPKFTSEEKGKKTIVIPANSNERYTVGGQAIAIAKAEILSEITSDFDVILEADSNSTINFEEALGLPERPPR